MGEVYEAVQEDLGRRVAIKVMSGPFANDPDLLQRFQREARAVAALGHPHIVAVTDFQDNPGEPPFFVMERLVGESLGERLERERSIEGTKIARIGEQVLSALAAAHEAGLVHRDVKPDNIFLCRTDTGDDLVKLLDFGVAKVAEEGGRLTTTGAIVGTLAYMAPEQARSEAIDGRADVYALGACMYHALTGRPPYDAPTAARLLAMLANTEPPPIDALRPDVDPVLRALVARAMGREPSARFPTARAMLVQLGGWLRGDSTLFASVPPAHTPVAVRVNDASIDVHATGGATPFSARGPGVPNVAGPSAPPPALHGTPAPAPGNGWSAPPPPVVAGPPPGQGWSAPPPAPGPYATPAPVVHPPSGVTTPTAPPRRSSAGIIVGAALALVGVSALATAGVLVHQAQKQAGTEIAYSGKITSMPVPGTAASGAPSETPSSATAEPTASAVPLPTVTMTTIVTPKPPTTSVATVAATVSPTGTGGPSDLSKLMMAVTQAHQAGDGRACLDAFDKLEKDPGYADPGGYKYMKANCLMMAGRCDEGRKLARTYWAEPRGSALQKMGPVEIENAVSGSAQMYCPTGQLTPEERARRAQMLLGKAQTNKDPVAIGKAADELAAALHAHPTATEDDRRMVSGYKYQLVNAYSLANRCADARSWATQICAAQGQRSIDICVDGTVGAPCKKAATP
jgi:serine/threonine-protein kinase